ncbi:MAG: HEAT repeat domain-containing protein [Anaerolineaceae bacterium]|nr:HEAT repeat domain-containing protein [Anaerolineaceae bacterium]
MTPPLPPNNTPENGTPDIEGAIRLLQSEDVQLRQFIAYLLGRVGDARAIEPLIDALRDEHVGVRGAAANALGAIGDNSAVPYILPLLKENNPQLKVWAAYALTKLGHDRFDLIVEPLGSKDVLVRRSAILALEQLGDRRAVEYLLPLQDDHARRFEGDTTIAEAAAKALAHLGYNVGRLPPRS